MCSVSGTSSGASANQQPARHLVAGPSGSTSQGPTGGAAQWRINVYPMEVVRIRERARSIELLDVFGNVTRSARVFLETYGRALGDEYHYRERNDADYVTFRDFLLPIGRAQAGKVELLRQKSRENSGKNFLRYVFENGYSVCEPRQVRAYLYWLGESDHAGLRVFARILTPCSNRTGDLIPIYRTHLESRVRSLYQNSRRIGSTDSFMLLFAEMAWAARSSVGFLNTLGRVHQEIAFEPIDEQGDVVLDAEPTLGIKLMCVGEHFCLNATLVFLVFYVTSLRPVLQRINDSFESSFWGIFRRFYGPTPHLEACEKDGSRMDECLICEKTIQTIVPTTTLAFSERDQKHLSDILRQSVYELRTNTIGVDQSISRSNPDKALALLDRAFEQAKERWKAYVKEYRDVWRNSQIKEIEFAGEKKLCYQTRDLVNEMCDMMLLERKTSSLANETVCLANPLRRALDSTVGFIVRPTRS